MVNAEHRGFELEKNEAQEPKSHSDRGLRRRELTRGLEHQEKPFGGEKMEGNKRMDEQALSLIEVIHFTEEVSSKVYEIMDEAEIYRVAKEECAKSKRYDMTIFLLTEDRSKLVRKMLRKDGGKEE